MFIESDVVASSKRSYKNGFLVYQSKSLKHDERKMSGYMIKRPNKSSIFSLKKFYDRYFIISKDLGILQILEKQNSKVSLKIGVQELIRIKDISVPGAKTNCPYRYSFTLVTTTRDFKLACPTLEERDLWVEAFYRILNVRIDDFKMSACLQPFGD